MRILVINAMLALGLLGSGLPLARAADPKPSDCKLTPLGSVEFRLTPSGMITFPAKINGNAVRLGLDASSPNSVIGSTVAAGMGIKPRQAEDIKYVDNRGFYYAELDRVEFAGVRLSKVEFQIANNDFFTADASLDDRVAGFLHIGFLTRPDIELDFRDRRLILWSSDHCKGRVVHWANRFAVTDIRKDPLGGLYFPLQLNGRWILTELETRSSQSVLKDNAYRWLFARDSKELPKDNELPPMTVSMEGIQINNARVRLEPALRSCSISGGDSPRIPARNQNCAAAYPFRLGTGVLSKLHLYIANQEKKLYFTTVDAGPQPDAGSVSPAAAP